MELKLFFTILAVYILISCSSPSKEIPVQSQDFCASIHRNDSLNLSQEFKPITEMVGEKSGAYVLEDGGGSLITRAWLSEYAEKTIDIQYFIFSFDNVGLIDCDYLVRAADRGVKVRILVDDMLVDAGIHEILTLDSHKNIEIKIYNPGVNLGKNIGQKAEKFSTDFRAANQRMHNKTFTVDGKVAITGGRNIADEYFDYDHRYNFRDRDVLLLGKVTESVQNSFEKFWNSSLSVAVTKLIHETNTNFSDKNKFNRLHQYACNPANFWPQVRDKISNFSKIITDIQHSGRFIVAPTISFVSDLPGKNDGSKGMEGSGVCTDSLINLIKQAKKTIYIQSPYLITTKLGQNLFRDAVKRGVRIKVLTNSLASTDNAEAFSGYQRSRNDLLKTGIQIFEFRPDAAERYKIMTGSLQKKMNFTPIFGLHAKSMVIDSKITVIGTFNLDPRSANLNTECVAIVRSAKLSEGVLKGMEMELLPENSWETTFSFNPDAKADLSKRMKSWTRKVVPKNIL